MKFCQETVSDLKKYFQGSYVKFPEAGEMLHMVEQVGSSCLMGKRWAPNEETGDMEEQPYQFLLHPDDEFTPHIEYVLPVKSYFNYADRAMLLSRMPARQYRRGINHDNTALSYLTPSGSFDGWHMDFPTLHAYVQKQQFVPLEEVKTNGISYAISKRMAVTAAGLLFVDRTRIGSINVQSKQIHLNHWLFLPEVAALVASQGNKFEVVAPSSTPTKSSRRPRPPKPVDEVAF